VIAPHLDAAPHLCLMVASCGSALGADTAPFNSHEVHPDGCITFRLRNAGATKLAHPA
jgi:hypothetical protein